jgi:L-amino acid N-acyltransferase
MLIRQAADENLPGILEIYNDVIATSNAVYTETPATLDDRRAWLAARRTSNFPVLVADDGGVVGFGSFGDFRPWPRYALTVEHSVHVRSAMRGRGLGTALVQSLN